ncbi:phage portal protein [Mycoplasma bovis]|nr:phage portal protein [Mycoplasmopsis bovis]
MGFFSFLRKKPKKITESAGRFQDFSYSLNDYSTSELLRSLSPSEFLMYGLMVRAVQLIANDIAKVNFTVQRKKANGDIEHSQDTYIAKLLNDKPNNSQTPWEFKKILIWNLLLYGSCPILIARDEFNNPTELLPVFPYYVNKVENESGTKYFYVKKDKPIEIYPDEIIWIEYEMIQGFDSLNIRTLFKSTISKIKENELSIINAIKNDMRSSMFIKVKDITNNEQRRQATEMLREMMERSKKTGSLSVVLDERWELGKATDIVNTQIDLQTRNSLGREFAASLGIPPAKLGIDDPNKYNSSVELNRTYVDNSLKPLLINICQRLTLSLANNDEKITFKTIDLLSVDIKSIQEFAASAINNGYATANEIRQLLGFDKHPDGDKLLANGTLTPVNDLSKQKGADIE